VQDHERGLLVARIVSGTVRVRLRVAGREQPFLLKTPDRQTRYEAEEVYAEALEEARFAGLYEDDDLLQLLYHQGLWDDEKQQLLQGLPEDIEKLKVGLFDSAYRSLERQKAREALAVAKAKLAELQAERHAYDHLTPAGAAGMARLRFLATTMLCKLDGSRVLPSEALPLVDAALAAYLSTRLSEAVYRELARTDPWRTLWSARHAGEGVFGVPAADLSEEQKTLLSWTGMYDSVHEHPQAPSPDVIADDDMLDGWFIKQKRERDKALRQQKADGVLTNEKIRNSQEVFLVVDSDEDAADVDALNDEHARAIKQQRLAHLARQGKVEEHEMPDTRLNLAMQRARARQQ
jgi:hypothetical protein